MQTFQEKPRIALGEKVAEEKGKLTGMSIKSFEPDGVTYEATFVGETQGFGRFPSGRGTATATLLRGPKTTRSTGLGVFITADGETIWAHLSATGKSVGSRRRSVCLVTYTTPSQKYAWMNEILLIADMNFSADLTEYTSTLYEWA